ncbi:MAG: hypothetical protein MZV63_18820 [Marinilabiliales bacterium]|nr:hypothetical protein [Marinilabiliales bacterium]
MTGYITGSLLLLAQQPIPDDAAIHDIRVMMKKHRAAIRLARPLLDEAVYNREYLPGGRPAASSPHGVRQRFCERQPKPLRKTIRDSSSSCGTMSRYRACCANHIQHGRRLACTGKSRD